MPKRKPKRQKFPLLAVVVGGLFLLISAVLFIQFQNNQSASLPSSTSGQPGIPYPEIERVSLADARSALDAGAAVFIDVRLADAYAARHISGALNIPANETQARLAELDPNQWIITYCT